MRSSSDQIRVGHHAFFSWRQHVFSSTGGGGALNNAPVINLGSSNNYSSTYVEGALSATAICPSATITDADNDPMVSLTIVGASISDGASEVLTFNTSAAFPLNANASTTTTVGSTTFAIGYVTLSQTFTITKNGGGTMPLADLQSLMRTITFANSDSTPTVGNRTFTFTANDGTDDSNSPVATVNSRATSHILSNATGGGNWSSTSTWAGGVVPQDGDTAQVVAGDTVTVDTSTTVGRTTGTNHGVLVKGTSAVSFGTVTVPSGITLTLRGVSTTVGAGKTERYSKFVLQAGSTLSVDCTSDYQTVFINDGQFEAIGTSGSRIRLTVPSARRSWNTSVSGEVKSTASQYTYDTRAKIGVFLLNNCWIANAAGTGIGSFGDSSLSLTSPTPVSAFATERASIAACTANGHYYVDYDSGMVYFYLDPYSGTAGFTAAYKRLDTSGWRGWGIDSTPSTNTDYHTLKLQYCDFEYMGSTAASDTPALNVMFHRSAASASNRLFELKNSTVKYCYKFCHLHDVDGTLADPILITGNTFGQCKGHNTYGYTFYTFRDDITYVTWDSNTVNSVDKFIQCGPPFSGTAANTGVKITNNTFTCSYILSTVFETSVSYPNGEFSGNTCVGQGYAIDSRCVQNFNGTSGNPATIRDNTFTHHQRLSNVGRYQRIYNNYHYMAPHHGYIASNYYGTNVYWYNNIFVDCKYGVELGYNTSTHLHDYRIYNNTMLRTPICSLGDNQDATSYTLISEAVIANNLCYGAEYAERRKLDASTDLCKAGLKEHDYNLCDGETTAVFERISNWDTFMMSSAKYNTNGSRNVLGVVLWDASYASAQATGRNLVLTVTTLDSNVTLSWGGGTAKQLVLDTGTCTSYSANSSENFATVTASGESWSTTANNAACPRCRWLKFTSGAAIGEIRAIVNNTATTLTVAPKFTATPTNTDTFVIYESEVQLFDSGGTESVRAGIYLPSLPTTSKTDSTITIDRNSVFTDPLLSNSSGTAAADTDITTGSPAISAATADWAPADDYDGTARPQGAGDDIGAWEFF